MKVSLTLLALLAVAALAACGGSNQDSATASSSTTVSSDNGQLVDSAGKPLYSADQEKGGMIRCTGGCTSIWLPLKAPASGQPTAASGVSGKLGVVKRPDGTRQVTLDGRPLYRFAEDGSSGKATGDGASDSFGGMKFRWHAEGTAASGGGSGGGGGSYSY